MMEQKEYLFRLLLVSGVVLAFLIMAEEGKAGPVQTIQSEVSQEDNSGVQGDHEAEKVTKKGGKEIKSLTSYKLGFRLAGTLKSGNEYAYALIVEEATGEQTLYGIGDSIQGARLLRIGKESVECEEEGRRYILKLTGGSDTGEISSEDTTVFEPVLNVTGPPVDENVPEGELPFFEPVFNEMGPIVGEDVVVEELPFFEPIYNSTGPPLDPEGVYEDLPEFVPVFNDSGPPTDE